MIIDFKKQYSMQEIYCLCNIKLFPNGVNDYPCYKCKFAITFNQNNSIYRFEFPFEGKFIYVLSNLIIIFDGTEEIIRFNINLEPFNLKYIYNVMEKINKYLLLC